MLSVAARRLLLCTMLAMAAFVTLGTGSAFATVTAKTGTASDVTPTTAILHGTVTAANADSAYRFVYGTTTKYGHLSTAVVAKVGVNNAAIAISGLAPNTTYHFQLVAADASVEPQTFAGGGDQTFTTTAAGVASATTGIASGVTKTSANVFGAADPTSAGAYAFQYGTTTKYTNATPAVPIPSGIHAVASKLTGLKPGTTYHYRLVVVAFDSRGSVYNSFAFGADRTFATKTSSSHRVAKYGTLSLRHRQLKVTGSAVSIPLHCSGPASARCAGRISLSAGRNSAVNCATISFSTRAHRDLNPTAHLSSACVALLNSAHGKLKATLKGTFSTHQATLRRAVTLHT
jgi:phosphodiesterase/alkaline phosphatase D-like protein